MKESGNACSECVSRDSCGVRRLLEAGGVEPGASIIRTKPYESFSREDSFRFAGALTVREGLVAMATYPDGGGEPLYSYIVGPGATATVAALLKKGTAREYVISLTSAEMCLVSKESIKQACANSGESIRELLALVFNITGLMGRLAWIRAGKSVRRKTERFLAEACIWHKLERGSSTSVTISHAAIASVVGARRCNVSTALGDLRKEGLVSLPDRGKKQILISDSFLDSPEYASNPWLNDERLPLTARDNIDL